MATKLQVGECVALGGDVWECEGDTLRCLAPFEVGKWYRRRSDGHVAKCVQLPTANNYVVLESPTLGRLPGASLLFWHETAPPVPRLQADKWYRRRSDGYVAKCTRGETENLQGVLKHSDGRFRYGSGVAWEETAAPTPTPDPQFIEGNWYCHKSDPRYAGCHKDGRMVFSDGTSLPATGPWVPATLPPFDIVAGGIYETKVGLVRLYGGGNGGCFKAASPDTKADLRTEYWSDEIHPATGVDMGTEGNLTLTGLHRLPLQRGVWYTHENGGDVCYVAGNYTAIYTPHGGFCPLSTSLKRLLRVAKQQGPQLPDPETVHVKLSSYLTVEATQHLIDADGDWLLELPGGLVGCWKTGETTAAK